MAYEVDIYTNHGTIIPSVCQDLDTAFELIRGIIDDVQLVNITKK